MSGSVSMVDGHIDPNTSRMTDKEIIKALECCKRDFSMRNCLDCPYNKEKSANCMSFMIEDALSLINRQQATIETLRKCVEQHHIIRKDGKSPLSLLTAEIRAEAIKECLGKIEQMDVSESDNYIMVKKCNFDNLVKEMAGDDK